MKISQLEVPRMHVSILTSFLQHIFGRKVMKKIRGRDVSPGRLRCVIAISLAMLVGLLGMSQSVMAQTLTTAPSKAPVSAKFLKFQDDLRAGTVKKTTGDGHPLGYVPPPVDIARINKAKVKLGIVGAPPASYDLRTSGKVTPVKNQGYCGSCWSFGAFSSLESWLRMGAAPTTLDFAEADLNDYHGFDVPSCEGGNDFMSTAYLARWSGPVLEANYPYPYAPQVTGAPGAPVAKHVQDVIFLPNRTGPTDNTTLKNAIMTYGAIAVAYYVDTAASSGYWNEAKDSYYYNGTPKTNHEVTIVGWNDSYAKTNFTKTPPGNGAFIVKNSWGTGWGAAGYFYMSYYDTSLEVGVAYDNAEATTTYTRAYEYDPLGWVGNWGFNSPTMYMANVFKASSAAPKIKAVSLYAPVPNTAVEISIYDNVTINYGTLSTNKPTAGTLKTSTPIKKTFTYAGYHTVVLPSVVSVTANKRFSVVVKITTPGYNYPAPSEDSYAGYSSAASAWVGQSFISSDKTTWYDLPYSTNFQGGNVCIKAFGSL